MNTDIRRRHDHIANAGLAALVGLTGLGALLNTVLNATGHPFLTALGLALVGVLVGAARWVARWVRERREHAADLIAGAAWRAEHMPHLLTDTDRALIDRAGIEQGRQWAEVA